MNEQTKFFSKLGNWFRGDRNGDLPLNIDTALANPPPKVTFLRPWARRNAAIANLQMGFATLNDLMNTIRENLEHQSRRQDELLRYLVHLPEALESIPENGRAHGEMLKAIHQQLEQQNAQQDKLAEILEKLGQSGSVQKETIGEIRDGVEHLRQTDEAISSHLNSLGHALQGVSKNSTTGAQVLEQMRDRIDSRDGQLERILHKQNTRFTTMLAIAIFLSTGALVAVSVIGYLLMNQHALK
jgi:ABC-type transporter Mla subunit MlaD